MSVGEGETLKPPSPSLSTILIVFTSFIDEDIKCYRCGGGWPQEVCVSDPQAKAQKAKDQERYGFYIEQSLQNV